MWGSAWEHDLAVRQAWGWLSGWLCAAHYLPEPWFSAKKQVQVSTQHSACHAANAQERYVPLLCSIFAQLCGLSSGVGRTVALFPSEGPCPKPWNLCIQPYMAKGTLQVQLNQGSQTREIIWAILVDPVSLQGSSAGGGGSQEGPSREAQPINCPF